MRAHPPDCTDVNHFKQTLELHSDVEATDESAGEPGAAKKPPSPPAVGITSTWSTKPKVQAAAKE